MLVVLSALLWLCAEPGLGQNRACLPVCSGDACITVNRVRVDFNSALRVCRQRSGELLTLASEADRRILEHLAEALPGSFWVGLRLPAGFCSDVSEPLRGYEWTSGGTDGSSGPPPVLWAESTRVCSPRCVSLSQRWMLKERPCSDKPDGFLCRTADRNACWEQEVLFRSTLRCSSAPCEHACEDMEGGFKCSCYHGYIPDGAAPQRCRPHCPRQRCAPVCTDGACLCADGFVEDGSVCVDIDECEMGACDHGCLNTDGSFLCFCHRGFVLREKGKCVAAAGSEPINPTLGNATLRSSSAASGPFLWIWLAGAGTLVPSVFLVRLYVVRCQKRRERSSSRPPEHSVTSVTFPGER